MARYELDSDELQNPEDAEFQILAKNVNEPVVVKISDATLNVSKAYKNENGDVIALDLKDETNGISKVTYLDGNEVEYLKEGETKTIGQSVENKAHKMQSYKINAGTTAVKVYQDEDKNAFAVVMLELDWKAPEVQRLYKNEANTRMIIKAMDNDSGIEKVLLDGDNFEIVAYSNEIFQQIQKGVTKVEVYDAVGHVTSLNVETDSTKPMTRIEAIDEADGKYKLTMKAPKSGLWKVIKVNDEGSNQVEIYDNFPQVEQTLTLDQVTGVDKIKVYDAVGNVAVVEIRNVKCVIVYANSNSDGSKIAVSLHDERKITKLAILNDVKKESVIEVFDDNGIERVLRWYETPKGTTAIKLYYKQPEPTQEKPNPDPIEPAEIILDKYEVAPIVVGNKAYSLIGISKIEYRYHEGENENRVDKVGKTVEFKENMPTKVEVDLTKCDSAVVYDSLNNSSNMPE